MSILPKDVFLVATQHLQTLYYTGKFIRNIDRSHSCFCLRIFPNLTYIFSIAIFIDTVAEAIKRMKKAERTKSYFVFVRLHSGFCGSG